MGKNKNLINNFSYNFKLRGVSSILIGIYIILGTFLIQTILIGYTTVDSPFSFLTIDMLELFIFAVTVLAILFSALALFFGNRRITRRLHYKVWNAHSKKSVWQFFGLFIFGYIIFFYLLNAGFYDFIIPAFLICYGLLLSLLNYRKQPPLYIFTIISILFGFIALFFPTHWFYTLISLGTTHVIYGILVKK